MSSTKYNREALVQCISALLVLYENLAISKETFMATIDHTFTIHGIPANHPPIVAPDALTDTTLANGATLATAPFFIDADNDPLSYSVVSPTDGSVTVDPVTGVLTMNTEVDVVATVRADDGK